LAIKLGEIARKLDRLFEVHRFVELSNWDFALSPPEREALLAHGSSTFRETFNGLLNGDERTEIYRVYLVVFPEQSHLDGIIAEERRRGAPGALVLTHHPCDMETSNRGFIPIPESQLDLMRATNISLYVLHAPLDCHAEISTSGALADGLGLERTGVFAPYVDGYAGVIAVRATEPFAVFAERVRRLCEIPYFLPDQVRFSGRSVTRVAIVAGGGDDLHDLQEAEAFGVDTFLAGHWWTPHAGEWAEGNRTALAEVLPRLSMNLLSASHDGSELVVFRDKLAPLIESMGLEARLVRQADHWR
jgi:putative NIF3 family GTP cyclohydrolase 1 type 2